MSATASEKQVNWIKSMFADATKGTEALVAAGQDEIVASLTTLVKPVENILVAVMSNKVISGYEASQVINALKAVLAVIRKATAPPTPVGLVDLKPERIITNRFAKACRSCGTQVVEGSGYAVLTPGGSWITSCKACAHQDPAVRAAEVQAETARRQAEYAAKRAAAAKQAEAERQVRYEINLFGRDLIKRAGLDQAARPKVRVAIPSATGNNDLDFFTVKMDNYGRVTVARVIGGHSDQLLNMTASHAALEALVLTESIPAAMATFGQELGFCGRCGRHLTDEDSRAVGIGPDCQKLFF